MYNRYIPQPDGTYRRNRMQEHRHPEPPRPIPPPPKRHAEKPIELNCPPPQQEHPDKEEKAEHHGRAYQPGKEYPAGSFLKNLLPKDLDTGDLLIILLLLLMAGDSEAEKSNALLTLALYFFL